MIFIIPIILGAAAIVSAGVGVSKGVNGFSKMQEAESIGKSAQEKYDRARESAEQKSARIQDGAKRYGELQIGIYLYTIQRFIDFIERIGQRASQGERLFLDGLEGISPQQVREYKAAALEAQKVALGGVKAVGAAYAAGQGTVAMIGLFGTASTGAAISGLSGAAAWNATLAWLGGGSLAAGGGGMALGTLVLGGITIGPALMIGGFVLGGQGEKAVTEARQYEAKVNVEMAQLKVFEDFLERVETRIDELTKLVNTINWKATNGLIELESQPFSVEKHAVKFQQVALLIKALAEILKTPVLDRDGELNEATAPLRAKYRTLGGQS